MKLTARICLDTGKIGIIRHTSDKIPGTYSVQKIVSKPNRKAL
jgi:hypothetical protein